MHADRYGLTPEDGRARRAEPAGRQAQGVVWPIRAGAIPPLAESFIARPETVAGLEYVLLAGETGQLSPGTDALWVSEVGTMLESGALATRIRKHTEDAFSASLPPPWFRRNTQLRGCAPYPLCATRSINPSPSTSAG